ncbi:PorP/SprF family type IX secretion system membrane protein [Cytophaga aurantiaca]|uniref:PorP/SprF family type IX secretion system membrane protein n=1 Tax=Cytophaga aurantiaca TaxID=29530 RepID=UPI00036D52F1|nr:type IX secretion system membrane protein PorP/SprF [Cytophaga aurantiaca]
MKKTLLLFLILAAFSAQAQIYPNIGQFQNVLLYYNPAYAGSGTQFRATGIYRTQWTKYPGAPNTQVVTAEAPLGKNVGGGIVLNRHSIGNTLQINFSASASYRIKTGRESFVQFGLKAGISQINFGAGSAFIWDENDPYLSPNSTKGIISTFGAGVFYKKKSFYAGLSIPDLVLIDPNKLYHDEASNKSLAKKNFFFMSGIKFNVTDFIALQPNVLVRYYPTRPLNYYINLSVIFNQTFTAGVGFMYPKALALYTNVNVTPKIILGYRYEFNTSGFALGNYGSSEILVRYGF